MLCLLICVEGLGPDGLVIVLNEERKKNVHTDCGLEGCDVTGVIRALDASSLRSGEVVGTGNSNGRGKQVGSLPNTARRNGGGSVSANGRDIICEGASRKSTGAPVVCDEFPSRLGSSQRPSRCQDLRFFCRREFLDSNASHDEMNPSPFRAQEHCRVSFEFQPRPRRPD